MAVLAACTALQESQDELCELDAVAGDGDEGLAMAKAARAIEERLKVAPALSLREVLQLAGTELGAVGGAMGALSFVLLGAIEETLSGSPREDAFDAHTLAKALAAAEGAVSSFGEVRRGDKSILDAIAHAQDAAERSAQEGATPLEVLAAAAAGASEGAQLTAAMQARVGRASRLGDRSVGSVDAGARSFALVLQSLSDACARDVT
jgi:dihydroxyacetone kinase